MDNSASICGDHINGYYFENWIVNDVIPESGLANEFIYHIFSCLTAVELAKVYTVSRGWCVCASDPRVWGQLKNMSPLLKVLDGSVWNEHGVVVEDEPAFDKLKDVPNIKKGLLAKIEKNKGVALLTIPKGFSIDMAVQISSEALKEKNIKIIRSIYDDLPPEMRSQKIDKTYRIVHTRHLLEGSRAHDSYWDEGFSGKGSLIDFVKNKGCEFPKVIETVALLTITLLDKGERLFDHYSYEEFIETFIKSDERCYDYYYETHVDNVTGSCTFCVETVTSRRYPLLVGYNSERGFSVSYDSFRGYSHDSFDEGAAGVWR